jgi:hypothetical protein
MAKYKKSLSERPSYKKADEEDKEAQIGSRSNILSKSFVTELWVKVIRRAIDDIALYQTIRKLGRTLSEEDLQFEESAYSFLFNDDHKFPVCDYFVDATCSKCNRVWTSYISSLSSGDKKIICPICRYPNTRKKLYCVIAKDQTISELSLKDLLEIWDVYNIDGFREGCRKEIKDKVERRMQTIKKRIKN